MLCWAVLVGVLGALSTNAFRDGIHVMQRLFTTQPGLIVDVTRSLPWYLKLLVPMCGGVAAGALLAAAARFSAGASSGYMEAVAIGNGKLSMREGLLRSFASLCTVSSGGSIGREGAMVHLSSLWASAIGRFACFGTARLRLLVACGAAAGVSSAYGAPIAGALFVAEIMLGTMAMESFGPLLVASASANIVMHLTGRYHVTYAMTHVPQVSVEQIVPFLVLGVLTGVAAPQFLKIIGLTKRVFQATNWSLPARLGLGGLLLGCLLLFMPNVAGNGYMVVHSLINSHWTWYAVVIVLVCKVLATALTVGSGSVGGVFTPSIFVGAAFGTLFGHVVAAFWPQLAVEPYIFTVIGMGAFLGAATNAPLMAILMIFEMTQRYEVVVPLMLACVVSYFVSRGIAQVAMYQVTLARDRDVVLRRRLRHAKLAELIKPADTVVSTATPVNEAAQMFLDYPVKYLYVVDENNAYQGVIAQQDLTRLLLNEGGAGDKCAGDVLRLDFVKALHPDMTFDEAQAYFINFSGERLPVVARGTRPTLLGVVYKSSLLERYCALKKSLDASGEVMLDVHAPRT